LFVSTSKVEKPMPKKLIIDQRGNKKGEVEHW
jgi:hypothetical protein